MSANNHNTLVTSLALASAGAAAVSLLTLTALQSDVVSRRILSGQQLQDKRHAEYLYRWTQALEKTKLQFQFFYAGGTQDSNIADDEELVRTTFLETQEQVQEFCANLLNQNNNSNKDNNNNDEPKSGEKEQESTTETSSSTVKEIRIGRIGTDSKRKINNDKELYVWLYEGLSAIYQVPLQLFGTCLADVMDRKITSSTFCFVSDASAGQGSQLIVDLIQAATKTDHVFFVEEPLWMVNFAVIAHQRLISSTQTLQRILFALCRLEAVRATNHESTILMTLPGQATTAVLLPLLQSVFPDDRHVFVYTGCVKTVEYSLTRRRQLQQQYNAVPKTMQEALRFTNPAGFSTPLFLGLHRETNVNKKQYLTNMAQLPLVHADTVETWMGSVNCFLKLKEDDKINGYLPYVLKLDYLLSSSSSLDVKSDRYWTLLSLLQYVLGSRSRRIPTEQVDAAISWLLDYNDRGSTTMAAARRLSDAEQEAIQNAVFSHKRILIENKTLLDTVQPTQHWTLKAATKAGGCACCAPEEDDEADATSMGALTNKMLAFNNSSGKAAAAASNGTRYVDGKTTFAFDPSRFTGI